jgi:flagellin
MPTVDFTRIAGNIGALNALNSLNYINNQLAVHQTRLATGKRINEAADDPSGFQLATTFDVRRQGLQVVMSAIGDAKNLLSTAEGGLKKIQDILVKMKNKAMEAVGDTVGDNERAAIQAQLRAYRDEIDNIVEQTEWNNTSLISGSARGATTASKSFLIDPSGTTDTFNFAAESSSGISASQSFYAYSSTEASGSTASATGLGLNDLSLTINSSATAVTAANKIEAALNIVKAGISQIGSYSARLTFKEEALSVQYVNTESAYNRIMNANMAEEQVNASKYLILQQTAVAMLAQANVAPQFLLTLFR